jgi:enediyne biosynthesis protein E4
MNMSKHRVKSFVVIAVIFSSLSLGCKKDDTLFEKVSSFSSGIDFENRLEENADLNVLYYDYIYNGAGVAIGDLNKDGLPDLYFSGNMVPNKLYINQGDLEFKEVTEEVGAREREGWKTGVTMADVNGDGWLDIYLCYAGLDSQQRSNQLFINNGIDGSGKISFSERAMQFGLDAPGTYSTQAYFLDYDVDGDLDLFLLNHGIDYQSSFSNSIQRKAERHPEFGNRLFRNDGGVFKDVSAEAGIFGGWLNYGLSAAVCDFNGDNLPDLYVSNDFDERDFFYLNSGDGKFKEVLKESFGHISKFTMGTDAADINNDGYPDLITLDMLPEDNYRQKLLKGPDGFDKYDYFVKKGFHFQQMRNMLHLNRGIDSTGAPVFSEIGQLAGISNTDWSWASLFADFDNDGHKDLFISNGYLRDFTNLDFQKYDFEDARQKLVAKGINMKSAEGKNFMFEYVNKMSSIKVRNYVFKNSGDLTFQNMSERWGLDDKNLTNGAAYSDLDNDGDLDMVVNNLNESSAIYRNNSRELNGNNYIRVRLVGYMQNTNALGAKVFIKTDDGQTQISEAYFARGFLSSVDPTIHFGVAKNASIAEVKIIWPDRKETVLKHIPVNQILTVKYGDFSKASPIVEREPPIFSDVTLKTNVVFEHRENSFVDYRNERLLLFKLSNQGPRMAVGDIDGNRLDDFFVTGAADQPSATYLQKSEGAFVQTIDDAFNSDATYEDVAPLFFDVDGDKDLDLFVVSGGNEFPKDSPKYQDRLYLNSGKGNFKRIEGAIPGRTGGGGSCAAATDYDNDGDEDLFVGGWTLPGSYPRHSPSRLLRNDTQNGQVIFADVTEKMLPVLHGAGVTRAAHWDDIDGDGLKDLVLLADWMPVRVFVNKMDHFEEETSKLNLERTNGFWSSLSTADVDNDGDIDILAGNMGQNGDLKASDSEPLKLYSGDFNNDGMIDPIVCNYVQGASYPIATRDELLSQLLPLRKKFIRYSQYANATINDILDSAQLRSAEIKTIYTLKSCLFRNDNGKFFMEPLPTEAQFAPIQSFVVKDFTNDGIIDVLAVGNLIDYRVEYGPFDASTGILLRGDGKGSFFSVKREESGLMVRGDVRDLKELNTGRKSIFLISKNNGKLQVLTTNENSR